MAQEAAQFLLDEAARLGFAPAAAGFPIEQGYAPAGADYRPQGQVLIERTTPGQQTQEHLQLQTDEPAQQVLLHLLACFQGDTIVGDGLPADGGDQNLVLPDDMPADVLLPGEAFEDGSGNLTLQPEGAERPQDGPAREGPGKGEGVGARRAQHRAQGREPERTPESEAGGQGEGDGLGLGTSHEQTSIVVLWLRRGNGHPWRGGAARARRVDGWPRVPRQAGQREDAAPTLRGWPPSPARSGRLKGITHEVIQCPQPHPWTLQGLG